MIFKLELSPQNFHYDVLYPLYSASNEMTSFAAHINVLQCFLKICFSLNQIDDLQSSNKK